MGRREDKLTRAAHIKRHTVGTSNEISFSVLDAAKNALDGERAETEGHAPRFGRISLFTLPGHRKKPVATPTKERGLPLSTGDFVSVEDASATGRFDTLDFSSPAASGVKLDGEPATSTPAPSKQLLLPAPAPTPVAPSKPKRSPEEEIARRKARRRVSKIAAISFVCVVSAVLLAMGGVYLYHDHQRQQDNVAQLDEAFNLITDADKTIAELDAVVSDPFAEGAVEKRTSVTATLEEVTKKLDAADEKARAASADLRESKDKEAANQAVAAISARRTLVKHGSELMIAAQAAQDAADHADEAWTNVLKADELARNAAKLVADTTAENVKASKDETNKALDALATAKASFEDLQSTYEGADFSPVLTYIDKRVEALGYAIASDDAFLAKDKDAAASQNEAYNKAEAEAADLAKDLPSEPSSVVREAFETTTAETKKAYSTARLQAGSADAFIRDYLGTEIK